MNWKKTLRWTAAMLEIVFLLTFVGGYFVLKTSWFHRFVLAKVIEEGQSATGGRIEIQNWSFHVSPLTATLYGITLHGAETPNAHPLLQTDRLTVGVSLGSLLRRRLHLTELRIEHPVVNISVNRDGKNNLPTPPPQKSSGSITVWDLAVRRASLNHGEIYYNDQKAALNADLYDLTTEVRFDPSATRYAGTVSYRDGRLQYANHAAVQHNLIARFSATPDGASLNTLRLTVGSSQLSARAELIGYRNPRVNATYQILIHTQDFAKFSPGVASSGDLRLAGEVSYQDVPGQSLLRSVLLEGNLTSGDLQTLLPDGRIAVRNLTAQYRLGGGNLQVRDIAAQLMNGELSGDLGVQRLDTAAVGTMHATLRRLSLEAARQSVARRDVQRMPVTGTMNAALSGAWIGSFKNIRLSGDLGLRAAVWTDAADQKLATPVDGAIHAAYDGARNSLTLRQTTLRIPSTSVVLDGQLSNSSNLRVHAILGDLHQLALLASSLRTAESEPRSQPMALSGTAKLDAIVQGSLQKPHVSGQLEADNLAVQGSQWKIAKLALKASPSHFRIEQGSLVSARQGALSFEAQVDLNNWSYQPADNITANLSAKGMALAELEHLANLSYPVAGNLSASISFQGSQLHPSGHGSLQLVNASAYNQPIQNLTAQFQAADDSINSSLKVNLPAGSATANLAYTPKARAYKVELHTPGITLQKLQAVQAKNLPLAGTLNASASGAGTMDNPQLNLALGIPILQVRQTAITGIQAQVDVANQRANLSLSSNIAQAFVRANATVDLTGGYNAQAIIETNQVPLDPLFAVYAPNMPADFHAITEVHASLKGPLKNASRLKAHLTIPTLRGSYQSLQFGNAGAIHADYANSEIVLAPAEIRGTETSLRFQGRVPVQNSGTMTLQAQGTVNMALLAMLSSDVKSAGAIQFDVRGGGSVGNPTVQGNIQVKNVTLSTSDAPIGLSQLNGSLDLTGDRVQISTLTCEVGGGEVSASGSIAYRPGLQFNVALQGKSVRLLYPEGVRTVLDSNLTFTGNMQAASLAGRTLIDSLNFTPDFDLSRFASQFNGISVPPTGESFTDNIKLAIAVQSAQNLSARSSQLSLEGAANLQVTGTASDPVIVGRLDLTSGELFFMNNRYQLQRGIVTFNNPNQTNPVLNVQATTSIQQYNLTLTLTGPIDKLSTNYVSDPSLPTADIISLIYRGETDEQAAAAGTSTDSLLASQAASQFSGGIQKLAGISSLQIDPTIGGNNSDPSARIALQQRVTKNFLFTFSTDVSQPESEIVQGEYQINKRWSVSAARDQLGGISVDGRYHTSF